MAVAGDGVPQPRSLPTKPCVQLEGCAATLFIHTRAEQVQSRSCSKIRWRQLYFNTAAVGMGSQVPR